MEFSDARLLFKSLASFRQYYLTETTHTALYTSLNSVVVQALDIQAEFI